MKFSLFLCLLAFGMGLVPSVRADDTPHVFWASDPVLPNDTVMAIGDNMSGVIKVRLVRLPDSKPSGATTDKMPAASSATYVKPLQATSNDVKFVVPAGWKTGAFTYQLVTPSDASKTHLIDAPEPWWLQGDGGDSASPGGWIRIFGKCLNFGGVSRAELVDSSGHKTVLNCASSDGYSLRFSVPESLPSKAYSVYVHNGTGGDAAWVKAGDLTVHPPDAWPNQVFNVMDYYGANAEKEIEKTLGKAPPIDRTAAIQAALNKAAANGGGVVYFPEGGYAIQGQLQVPPRTILRGAGEGLVTLWWGKGGFALDGGSSDLHLDDTYSTPSTLINGGSFGLEDMSIILPREYGNAISAGDNFEMQHVRMLVDRFWIRSGAREDGTSVIMGDHGTVTDCDILAKGIAIAFSSGHDEIVANNRIQAGKCPIGMQTADGMIVENNDFVSLNPTAYTNLSNVGRNIYFANNKQEAEYAQQSDFSWTFDGYGVPYTGPVATTDGTSVTLGNDPAFPAWAGADAPLWNHAAICVLRGKGMGQYRFVTSHAGRVWQVDSPFEVPPDQTSVVTIIPFRGRVLLVSNHFEDSGWVNLGYGTSIDVIGAHNSLYRVGAFLNLGLRDLDGVQPSWYVQYLDNDVYEGSTYCQTTGDERNAAVYNGTSTRGAVHRRTHIHDDNSGNMNVGGTAQDVVFEHCQMDNKRSSVSFDADTNGVLVRGMVFKNPGSHYSGNGLGKAVIVP